MNVLTNSTYISRASEGESAACRSVAARHTLKENHLETFLSVSAFDLRIHTPHSLAYRAG